MLRLTDHWIWDCWFAWDGDRHHVFLRNWELLPEALAPVPPGRWDDTWERPLAEPVLAPDPRWYETLDRDVWFEETCRDPWVFADPSGEAFG